MAKVKVGELILNTLAPTLETVITIKLTELLDKIAAKNAVRHEVILTSLYGPIDVELEDLTDGSKTKIDDAVVNGLKAAIETSAANNGVILQNLDSD